MQPSDNVRCPIIDWLLYMHKLLACCYFAVSLPFPIIAAYWPILALSVSEKLVFRFRFLALCWLAYFSKLQHTLHASVCFASCNRSDPSVLVAGKSRSRRRIPVLILKKTKNKQKQLLKDNGTYSATFSRFSGPRTIDRYRKCT